MVALLLEEVSRVATTFFVKYAAYELLLKVLRHLYGLRVVREVVLLVRYVDRSFLIKLFKSLKTAHQKAEKLVACWSCFIF